MRLPAVASAAPAEPPAVPQAPGAGQDGPRAEHEKRVPWNPAVPPPPVTGAPDGTVLVGVVVIVCVTVTTG